MSDPDQGNLFGYYSPATGEVSSHPPLCCCGHCSIPVERFTVPPQPAAELAATVPAAWEEDPVDA